MLGLILLIIVIILLLGGFSGRFGGHGYGYGNRGIGTPTVVFKGEHDGGTSTLNLPIGTNNQPNNVFEVLKMPPAGELSTSPMGTNRFYN